MIKTYRIYYDRKSAVVVDEGKKIFFQVPAARAKEIAKEKILTINPRTALHRQISLLLEIGFEESKNTFDN